MSIRSHCQRVVYVLFVVIFFALVFSENGCLPLVTRLAAAKTSPQTWDDTSKAPVISNGQTLDYDSYDSLYRGHIEITGDLPCQAVSLPIGQLDGSAPTPDPTDRCWYPTGNSSIVRVRQGGYQIELASRPGVAGYVDSINSQLFPTPNPDVFIQTVPDENDSSLYHMYFRSGKALEMTAEPFTWGGSILNYTFANPPSGELKDSSGKPYLVDDNLIYSQINYSDNGRWMSIWDGYGTVTRVDLTTFTATSAFVEPTADAQSDYAVTAVSPSGRYMAVNIFGKPLAVVDFDSCQQPANDNSLHAPYCATRLLGTYLQDFTGAGNGLGDLPHFYSDDLLGYYVGQHTGEDLYYEYLFRAPNTNQTDYIALGDSYASGEGEGNSTYYPGTDVHNKNMCHLSRQSYPFLIGHDLKLDSTHSVACSGATILNVLGNGVYDRSLKDPNRTNQYTDEVANNSLGPWLPGFNEQIKYIRDTEPTMVTISMGGNDIGFKSILEDCLGWGTCYNSYEDRLELADEIDSQYPKLVDMYTQIKQSTVPDARLYVIGYPSIVKSGGDCGAQLLGLNVEETAFANELIGYLDMTIRLAAERAGVQYVDTYDAFAGYRLCEGSDGNRAVNGLTVGHDAHGIISNGSFHPTKLGHQLLAQWIEKATKNFTVTMPRADSSISEPLASQSSLLVGMTKSGRMTNELMYDDEMDGAIFYQGSQAHIDYTASTTDGVRSNPFAPVQANLHSDTIPLGTFETDAQGNISADITIPKSAPVGFHKLDLYVQGTDGRTYDIFAGVYVAASPTDYDGNGVSNSQESCLIFQGSGQDTDHDGIDDACDEENVQTSPLAKVSTQAPGNPGSGALASATISTNSSVSAEPNSSRGNHTLANAIKSPLAVSPKDHQRPARHNHTWLWLEIILPLLLLTFFSYLRYSRRIYDTDS